MTRMDEVWKPIKTFPNYEASSLGKIRSVYHTTTQIGRWGLYTKSHPSKILSPKIGRGDYLYVNLYHDGNSSMRAVHRLVLEAFSEKCPDVDCNHKDLNRQNNHITNLEWCTRKENLKHAEQNGRIMCWEVQRRRAASRRNTLQTAD